MGSPQEHGRRKPWWLSIPIGLAMLVTVVVWTAGSRDPKLTAAPMSVSAAPSPAATYPPPSRPSLTSQIQGKGVLARTPRAPTVIEVDFVDSAHGFMVACAPPDARDCGGLAIWATGDGGKRWRVVRRGLSVKSPLGIDFVTTKLAYGFTSACCHGPGKVTIVRSTDGGATWQAVGQIYGDVSQHAGCGCGGGPFERQSPPLQMVDARVGWFLSDGGYHHDLYRTLDAGVTWGRVAFDCPTNMMARGISFLSASTGFLVCDAPLEYSSYHGKRAVLRTQDGGVSWQLMSKGPVDRAGMYSRIRFVTARIGYLSTLKPRSWSNQGGIAITTDGGVTFHPILGSRPKDAVLFDVAQIGPHSAIASTGAGLMLSRDDGRSWKQLYPSRAPRPYGYPVFTSPSQGVSALFSGWTASASSGNDLVPTLGFFATEDGGVTWSRKSDLPGDGWPGAPPVLSSPTASEVLIWNPTAKVLHESKDGGASWSAVAIPQGYCGQPVAVSATTWMLLGEGCYGWIYQSVNGAGSQSTAWAPGGWDPVAVPANTGTSGVAIWSLVAKNTLGVAFDVHHWNRRVSVFPKGVSIVTMAALDLEHAWVVGSTCHLELAQGSYRYCHNRTTEYHLFSSDDGGLTWRVVHLRLFDKSGGPMRQSGLLGHLQFVSPTVGYWWTGMGLMTTADGGVNWAPVG